MRELQRLGADIADALPVDEFGERWLSVDKKTEEKDLARLPVHLRNTVQDLAAGVKERVPDDVNWSLNFDKNGTRFVMEYEDGNTGTIDGGRFYPKRTRLFAFLDSMDWDRFRGESLQGMDIFDQLLSEADDKPANIPSSEEAAKKWAKPLEEAILDFGPQRFRFVLVVARDDCGVDWMICDGADDIIGRIGDAMTTQCDILFIVDNGVALDFGEIEERKREAVEGLGPISRAKAERRFGL